MNATVVVLGDLGRSPRMQYHARELARHGASITLIGYGGQGLVPEVEREPRIAVRALRPPLVSAPRRLPRTVYILYSLFKQARLCVSLAIALLRAPPADVVLVQSPPALPTIAVALAVARLRGSRLVVDWHNLGTPLIQRTLGARSVLARLHGRLERAIGRRADAHLCVSTALRAALAAFGVRAEVVRDGPGDGFAPLPASEAARVLHRAGIWTEGAEARPLVIVSPTGWTEEEDTQLLLAALRTIDAECAGSPALVVLLTGRGPQRADFEHEVAALRLERVRILTTWLEPADYPQVLAACDVGLSLHRSFSGLDPAMKVADLQGAGLPIVALDHGCVREQLGSGGVLFADAAGLTRVVLDLIRGGRSREPLISLRRVAQTVPPRTFEHEWRDHARSVLITRS